MQEILYILISTSYWLLYLPQIKKPRSIGGLLKEYKKPQFYNCQKALNQINNEVYELVSFHFSIILVCCVTTTAIAHHHHH